MIDAAVDPVLDYRYAWRWLLPITDGQIVALIGFSDEERAFWRQSLPEAIISDDPATAPVWLVQDTLPRHRLLPDTLQTLGVIGSRPVMAAWRAWLAGRFATVQDYGLLPTGRPRVVIPLGAPAAARQSLALHRPGRRLARLAVWGAGQLTRLGWDAPLRGRGLCIAMRTGPAIPQGARAAGLVVDGPAAPTAYALCLGNPESNRKTVVLPLGGSEPVILKAGETPAARAALRREASVLQALSQSTLAGQAPRLLKVSDTGRQLTLHQEYRPRLAMREGRLETAALGFLAGLSRLGRESRPLAAVLKTLPEPAQAALSPSAGAAYARVRAALAMQAAAGAMIVGHRSHGDFAPWNCAWTAQGFFVYDWEVSQAWDMALGDAFYYVIGPFLLVRNSAKVEQAHRRAIALGRRLVAQAGLAGVEVEGYFLLWAVKSLAVYPELGQVLEYVAGLS